MTTTKIAELDFAQVKENLKTYLKGQTAFKDYNFEGSNMNVLLDVLAYNTFQNNFYTNMAINEMFLDTAQLKESVVSHAKALNYVPRSRSSARALVNVTLNVPALDTPTFVVIPSKSKFTAQCGTKSFSFYTLNSATITPVNGTYKYSNLEIYEGTWVTEYFSVTNDSTQRFVLSNDKINTNTISVQIKENSSSITSTEYTIRNSIFGVELTDPVFYIQGAENDKYELIFGKDKFGAQPVAGNVIVVEYMVTNGAEANDVNTFAIAGTIGGYSGTCNLSSASSGGAEREDIDSIKFYAPRSIQVQDRAVTEKDYEILLKSRYPEIQAISVYGGEELNPPRYGRVVIAVDVMNAEGVSESNKSKYASYLSDKTPVGIEPIIISPEFMHVEMSATVYYNTKKTALGEAEIAAKVLNAISAYNDTYINDFKATFRPSKLSAAIDACDVNILSNDLETMPFMPLVPTLNMSNTFDVTFGFPLVKNQLINEGEPIQLHRATIKSSTFTINGRTVFLMDDGKGIINIVKYKDASFTFVKKNVGTVNYDTGRVIIKNLSPSAYSGSEIKLIARPINNTITSPKNRILSIRTSYSGSVAPDVVINAVGV
jgi:hypothetical protein